MTGAGGWGMMLIDSSDRQNVCIYDILFFPAADMWWSVTKYIYSSTVFKYNFTYVYVHF